MFKSSAGSLRTPRKQAEKMGTSPTGFEGEMPYDPQGGVPGSAPAKYDDKAEAAKPVQGGHVPDPKPFK